VYGSIPSALFGSSRPQIKVIGLAKRVPLSLIFKAGQSSIDSLIFAEIVSGMRLTAGTPIDSMRILVDD